MPGPPGGWAVVQAAVRPPMAQLWPNYGPTMAQSMAQLWPNYELLAKWEFMVDLKEKVMIFFFFEST